MTLVLFSWLSTNPYFKELTNVNLRKEMYHQRIKSIEEEVLPFGFINTGLEEEVYQDASGQVWSSPDEDRTPKYDFL
jgi:hypothetical protein